MSCSRPRVRRDSETSADSWSLVEEDRLDDDFSINSTEAEEEEESEPIVEEPLTSSDDDDDDVEEEEETASELSDSDASDLEIQVEIEEETDGEEGEEEEDVEMSVEEREQLVREIKEEFWKDGDGDDDDGEDGEDDDEEWRRRRRSCRVLLFISLFLMIFPIADICTSWVLSLQSTPSRRVDASPVTFYDSYSRQCYGRQCLLDKIAVAVAIHETAGDEAEATTSSRWGIRRLGSLLEKRHNVGWTGARSGRKIRRSWNETLPEWPSTAATADWHVVKNLRSSSRALAPIPPAPFTPRKAAKPIVVVPRHQPCLVHVNESKWTCHREKTKSSAPAVAYSSSYKYLETKWRKSKGRSGGTGAGEGGDKRRVNANNGRAEICGKKASESMRSVISSSDQCDSRHYSKYTPRGKHAIAFKTPLPCHAPHYRPTLLPSSSSPRKSTPRPSTGGWSYSKRSHLRAQLRHTA